MSIREQGPPVEPVKWVGRHGFLLKEVATPDPGTGYFETHFIRYFPHAHVSAAVKSFYMTSNRDGTLIFEMFRDFFSGLEPPPSSLINSPDFIQVDTLTVSANANNQIHIAKGFGILRIRFTPVAFPWTGDLFTWVT